MHPKRSGQLFVFLLVMNLTAWIGGIVLNFLPLEPALWAGAVYGIACASSYPLYVRHQRRNLHRYSDDMRLKVEWSFGTKPWKTHAALIPIMAVAGLIGLSTTGAAIYTRIAGKQEERTFTVAKSEWVVRRKHRCYKVTLLEFPKLGQISAAPCYDQKFPEGTRLIFSGYHSSLGSWYSAIRVEQ